VEGGGLVITVVSCVWGDYADRYLERWWDGLQALDPQPAEIILSTDRKLDVPVRQIVTPNRGEWAYNARWNEGIAAVETAWVGVLGFDDTYLPGVFAGLPSADEADVWMVGYRCDAIGDHIPPPMTGEEFVARRDNPSCYASPFTRRMWEIVGGFRDIAFSDWALLRDIALAGGRFVHSGKFGIQYNWHHDTSMSGANAAKLTEHLDAARVTELRNL
jgi:hypothetical protein